MTKPRKSRRTKELDAVTTIVNKVDPKRDGQGKFRKRSTPPQPEPKRYGH